MNKIKVLVVDDSRFFRELIKKGIEKDGNIEVVATAADPYEARDLIIEHDPDVVTLDVEMPRMDGVEFLKKLMPQYPLPVVMVSSVSERVVDALRAGAVDFVVKPDSTSAASFENFLYELIIKVKIASIAKVVSPNSNIQSGSVLPAKRNCNYEIIAIGASTGGTEAIYKVVSDLPDNSPGVVIVQHMPPIFTKMYADRLNKSCKFEVLEAKHGDAVLPGRVLIAPGDFQMCLKIRNGTYYVDCFSGEKVNGHCPSVDVLFESVAQVAKEKSIGVLLTGMGYDGAKGLLHMKDTGALTIGQDEASSVVYGMPKVAFNIGAVDIQAPLDNISQLITEVLTR